MTRPIIHVVCGVGGAGKTTTAAALGVAAARQGRRAVVLTIDPARRLADALGIPHLGNEPAPVEVPGTPEGGALEALMLDRKATWDDLVREHATDTETVERLLSNRYYEAVSTRLTGGHEWMAIEKLHRLVAAGRWDVIVVDTPPAQHALDFLDAPERIGRMLDGRLIRSVLRPARGLLGMATRRVVDVVRRLAGDAVLADLEEFFRLVGGLSDGFRARGAAMQTALADRSTRYWLVAPADGPRTEELVAFQRALREHGSGLAGLLLNRFIPPLATDRGTLSGLVPDTAPRGISAEAWSDSARWLRDRVADRARRAERHAGTRDAVGHALGVSPLPIPEVEQGIRDVHGLVALTWSLPDPTAG